MNSNSKKRTGERIAPGSASLTSSDNASTTHRKAYKAPASATWYTSSRGLEITAATRVRLNCGRSVQGIRHAVPAGTWVFPPPISPFTRLDPTVHFDGLGLDGLGGADSDVSPGRISGLIRLYRGGSASSSGTRPKGYGDILPPRVRVRHSTGCRSFRFRPVNRPRSAVRLTSWAVRDSPAASSLPVHHPLRVTSRTTAGCGEVAAKISCTARRAMHAISRLYCCRTAASGLRTGQIPPGCRCRNWSSCGTSCGGGSSRVTVTEACPGWWETW